MVAGSWRVRGGGTLELLDLIPDIMIYNSSDTYGNIIYGELPFIRTGGENI